MVNMWLEHVKTRKMLPSGTMFKVLGGKNIWKEAKGLPLRLLKGR